MGGLNQPPRSRIALSVAGEIPAELAFFNSLIFYRDTVGCVHARLSKVSRVRVRDWKLWCKFKGELTAYIDYNQLIIDLPAEGLLGLRPRPFGAASGLRPTAFNLGCAQVVEPDFSHVGGSN